MFHECQCKKEEITIVTYACATSYHPILSGEFFFAIPDLHGKGTNLGSLLGLHASSAPRVALMKSSISAAVLPIAPRVLYMPTTPTRPPSDPCPVCGNLPAVGLSEETPQKLAGIRTLPPKSVPGSESTVGAGSMRHSLAYQIP